MWNLGKIFVIILVKSISYYFGFDNNLSMYNNKYTYKKTAFEEGENTNDFITEN